MFAIISAIMFLIIIILTVLLIFGAPIGELTMGGRFKVLPPSMRIMAVFMLVTQVFAMIIILQGGGWLPLWFSENVTRIICFVFAGYFALNTFMNFFSFSKKEKYVMTPMSFVNAICFFVTAIQM